MDKKKVAGGTGRSVKVGDISDVSGQVAIGEYINQFKIEKPAGETLVKLIEYLDKKRQEDFNKEILNKYAPSELPDYPPKLKEFVTTNRVEELTKALIYLQEHRILLISGIGGIGKTTLARALIETRPANVPLPFWFDFSKKMDATLGDVLEKLAGYMNAPDIAKFGNERRDAGQDDINRLTGELQKREPLWLVFDNLETILYDRYFHESMDSLFTSLRSNSHKARIIVTSRTLPLLRNGESLIDVIEEEKQELRGLKTNFAVDYLIKNGLAGVERKKLEELAESVDGHPLALKLLVELVKDFGISDTLNDLKMYKNQKVDTIKKTRKLFDKLAGDEKELLESISVFRLPEPMSAIKGMFTDTTSIDAVKKLINKSLLETDHKGKYWLHPLVREFAYDDLRNKIDVHKLAYQYYLSLPLPEKRTKKEDVQPLIEAHYHACKANEYDLAAGIMFVKNLDEDLDRWGENRTLVELYEGMLPKNHLRDKPLLSSIEIHGSVIGNLGSTYYILGEVKKAIEYCEKALKIAQEIGDKHGEGQRLGNLGNVYSYMGDERKAIEYYEKALKITQEIGDKRAEGVCLGNLGSAYSNLSDVKKATEYYEKALKIAHKIDAKQDEGAWLGALGNVYSYMGDERKAIEYYEKALKIAQEIGDKHGEGTTLGNLGTAYQELSDVKKAIEYYEKALKIAQETGDKSSEGTWLGNLGAAYYSLEEVRKAIEYHEMALKITQQIGDRKGEGRSLGNLGAAYYSLEEVRKAIEYYEMALKITQEIGDRKGEGRSLGELGIAYGVLGELRIAIEYFEKTIKIAQEIGDRKGEGIFLGNLGKAYRDLGEVRKAIEYYEMALKITQEIGDRNSEGKSLGGLGIAYEKLSDVKKAIEYYEKALKIAQETGDKSSEGTWLINLGATFQDEKKYKEALKYYKNALRIFKDLKDEERALIVKENMIKLSACTKNWWQFWR